MKTTTIQSAPATFHVCDVSMNKVPDRFAAFDKTFQLIGDQFKDHFPDARKMVYLGYLMLPLCGKELSSNTKKSLKSVGC